MKRKILTVFIAFACAFCLAFGAVGCNPEDGSGVNENQTAQGGQDGGSAQGGQNEDGQGTGGGSGGSGETGDQGSGSGSGETGGQGGSGGHKHNFGEFVPEQPATCTEAGRKGYYFCADCNKYFDVQKNELGDLTIPAKGHSYISVCDQTEHWRVCNICGEEEAHTAHVVSDGMCETCGYSEHCTEGLAFSEVEYDGKIVSYSVSKGTATDNEIFIPSFHENLPVSEIDSYAFRDCTNITSVTIGNGVAFIGASVFKGCVNLVNIQMPDSVLLILDHAFSECASLKSIKIPDGVIFIDAAFSDCSAEIVWGDKSSIKEISSRAFVGYKGACVDIPDSVISIGEDAFNNCAAEIKWGNNPSIKEIASGAFRGYKGTSITIPDSVTTIGSSAFYNCINLISITIGKGVTSIGGTAFGVGGGMAFGECYKLIEVINLSELPIEKGDGIYGCVARYALNVVKSPEQSKIRYSQDYVYYEDGNTVYLLGYKGNNTVLQLPDKLDEKTYEIYGYAFYGNGKITEVTIPDGVTSIGERAFSGCTSLINVTIGNGVTSIGYSAYDGCTSLEHITIPDSVTSIGYSAFASCKSLENITVDESNTAYSSQDGILYDKHKTTLIRVPETKSEVTIPDGVTSIGSVAFTNCRSLTSIIIPDGVTSIGSGAFENCTNLTSITIPDSVITIGYDAFTGTACSSNQNNWLNGMLYIDNCLISTRYELPDKCEIRQGTKLIADSAFNGADKCTSIIIPDSVTSIGVDAFYCCKNLTSIIIPDSVTFIGESAFERCTSLESITLPFVGDGSDNTCFGYIFGASRNTSVLIPSSLKTVVLTGSDFICNNAFAYCTSLESITIPNSVTSIGRNAFGCCENLINIQISDSVKTIGESAFERCTSLTNIIIPDSVTSIGFGAFYGCTNLESITVVESNTAYASRDGILYDKNKTTLIQVPATKSEVTILDSVTSIDTFAFYGCENLERVIFDNPNGWYCIGDPSATSRTDIPSEDLQNPETAAGYLKNTYFNYYWHRETA